jgi:TATA-box binding protein (TBP) (component of TFIID and TFIIIB)
MSEIRRLDDELECAMDDVSKSGMGMFQSPTIVTMTIVYDLGQTVDLEDVREGCAKFLRTGKSFMNCATLSFGKKAMKVFKNGKLHITGCRSNEDARECCETFLDQMAYDVCVDDMSHKILMMNVCVRSSGQMLDPFPQLDALQEVFDQRAEVKTRYHPDIYQGLVLKVEAGPGRVVTVLTFYTGTLMFMGVKHPAELRCVSEIVYDTFRKTMATPCA